MGFVVGGQAINKKSALVQQLGHSAPPPRKIIWGPFSSQIGFAAHPLLAGDEEADDDGGEDDAAGDASRDDDC